MSVQEDPGDHEADGAPSMTAAGGDNAGDRAIDAPSETDLLRGEVAALQAKLDLVLAQLKQARYNTELAVEERDQLLATLNRLGFARARQAVHLARRLRARLRRLA